MNAIKALVSDRPLTILFLGSNPRDKANSNLDQIHNEMTELLTKPHVRFETRLGVQPENLLKTLKDIKPDVVHFQGHGDKDGLLFSNTYGKSELAAQKGLINLFKQLDVTCVVLNCCNAAVLARDLAKYVKCAIGASSALEINVAKAFVQGFYGSLTKGQSIKQSLNEANIQITLLHGMQQSPYSCFIQKGCSSQKLILCMY